MKRGTILSTAALLVLIGTAVAAEAAPKITYMTWFTGAGLETKKQLIAEFMQQNPDIEVEVLQAPNGPSGLQEKAAVMSAGGAAPDVTEVQHAILEGVLTSGLWEDLGQYMRNDRSFDVRAYFPEMLKFFNRNNTVGGSGQMALPVVSYAQAGTGALSNRPPAS